MRGLLSQVWFDRHKISPDCPEHLESIDTMRSLLGAVIQEEVRAGVPKHRMIIGGFSMGGAMALHLACRDHPEVAGVFALSSFLNKGSVVYKDFLVESGIRGSINYVFGRRCRGLNIWPRFIAVQDRRGQALPELFQCHGAADELVLHRWGEETEALKGSGDGHLVSLHPWAEPPAVPRGVRELALLDP